MAAVDKIPKKGKVYRFRHILFWAQGGCICLEDARKNGDFKALSRNEFKWRIVAFRDALLAGADDRWPYDRNETTNFIVNACAAVKEAKQQGDLFNPRVVEEKERERLNQKGFIYLGTGTENFRDFVNMGPASPDTLPDRLFSVTPGGRKIRSRIGGHRDFPHRANEIPRISGMGIG